MWEIVATQVTSPHVPHTDCTIYQRKVVLLGISPMIGAVCSCAESTIADLHHILQITMGWTDPHLHQFRIRVAGTIVRFYTLRAPSLVRDKSLEPFSWSLFAPIRRKYADLALGVVRKSPGRCSREQH